MEKSNFSFPPPFPKPKDLTPEEMKETAEKQRLAEESELANFKKQGGTPGEWNDFRNTDPESGEEWSGENQE